MRLSLTPRTVSLLSVLLLGVTLALFASSAHANPAHQANSLKWEYRDLNAKADEDPYPRLNKLGEEGWEAYAVTIHDEMASWELKRRRP